jgi:hypothetical protein
VGPAGFAAAAVLAALELPLLLLEEGEEAAVVLPPLLVLAEPEEDKVVPAVVNDSSCDAPHTPETVHVGWLESGLMQYNSPLGHTTWIRRLASGAAFPDLSST